MLRKVYKALLWNNLFVNPFIKHEGSLGQETTLDILADFTTRIGQGSVEFVSASSKRFVQENECFCKAQNPRIHSKSI